MAPKTASAGSEAKMSGKLTEARRAWEAACRAWSQDTLDQIEETMRLGEVMMFAATDLICALEVDSDRYRHLRNRDAGPPNYTPPGLFIGQVPENLILTEEDADAAIDAALSREAGHDG